MICFYCFRPIRGAELAHRVEWRRAGADVTLFGEGQPGGPLGTAQGMLLKVAHHKCFHADKKQRELAAARGAEQAADAAVQPREDTDWRHQEVMDVGDLIEGDRDRGGAGPAGR